MADDCKCSDMAAVETSSAVAAAATFRFEAFTADLPGDGAKI